MHYGRLEYSILISCRICGVLSCFLMACAHLSLSFVPEASQGLNLYAPFLVGWVFTGLMGLHLTGLVKMCRFNRRLIQPQGTMTQLRKKSLYARYFGRDGLFGRRGEYYNLRIILREAIELPSQSYQAYLVSQRVPNQIFPMLYGLIIAFDCIVVPLLLTSPRLTLLSQRNGVLLLDILTDITVGAILPLTLMVPIFYQMFRDFRQIFQPAFAAEVISTVRHLMITSPLDLFISVIPLIFCHFLINTVHYNYMDGNDRLMQSISHIKVVSTKPQLFRLGRLFCTMCSAVWGIFLLIQAFKAPTATSCEGVLNQICTKQVHPWFESNQCKCLAFDIHCSALQHEMNSSHSVYQLVDSIAQTQEKLLYLSIRQCPLKEIPPSVLNLHELLQLNVEQCPIASFELPVHQWSSLLTLSMDYTALSQLPETLKHLPPRLSTLSLSGLEMKHLPSWTSDAWSSLMAFNLDDADLNAFPGEILHWKRLRHLHLMGNPKIQSIPDDIKRLGGLKSIHMDGCRLTSLPSTFTSLKKLQTVTFGKNQLQQVPWTMVEMQSWNSRFNYELFLVGNPVCQEKEYQGLKACQTSFSCAQTCPPKLLANNQCEHGCNTTACSFDAGDCFMGKG